MKRPAGDPRGRPVAELRCGDRVEVRRRLWRGGVVRGDVGTVVDLLTPSDEVVVDFGACRRRRFARGDLALVRSRR